MSLKAVVSSVSHSLEQLEELGLCVGLSAENGSILLMGIW